jgi:hypothetical protein
MPTAIPVRSAVLFFESVVRTADETRPGRSKTATLEMTGG